MCVGRAAKLKQELLALMTGATKTVTVRSSIVAAAATDAREEATVRRVKEFIAVNQNRRTREAYESGWRGFEKYLGREGVVKANVKAAHIADYLRERMEEQGVAASTINGDRAAIMDKFRMTPQQAEVESPLVSAVMAVVKVKATQSKPKRHMSAELLSEVLEACDEAVRHTGPGETWMHVRNAFLIMLMMMGMLRESEAVALNVSDVVAKEEMIGGGKKVWTLQIAVVKSKTDQAKNGALVLLAANPSKPAQCPVERFHRFVEARATARVAAEALFTTNKGERMQNGTPCGIVQRAVAAANKRWNTKNPEDLEKHGEPTTYGSHSCRRGGVTAARLNGVSMLDIQRHGRWKSLVVFAYVGQSAEERLAVTKEFLARNECAPVAEDVPSAMAGQLKQASSASVMTVAAVAEVKEVAAATVDAGVSRMSSITERRKRRKGGSDDEEPTLEEREAELMEDYLFAEQMSQGYGEEAPVRVTRSVQKEKTSASKVKKGGKSKRRRTE